MYGDLAMNAVDQGLRACACVCVSHKLDIGCGTPAIRAIAVAAAVVVCSLEWHCNTARQLSIKRTRTDLPMRVPAAACLFVRLEHA